MPCAASYPVYTYRSRESTRCEVEEIIGRDEHIVLG